MPKAAGDAKLLIQSLHKAYAATPTNLKAIIVFFSLDLWPPVATSRFTHRVVMFVQIIDLYVVFAVASALVQVRVLWLLVHALPRISGLIFC